MQKVRRVTRVKVSSALKRWEYWRSRGIDLNTGIGDQKDNVSGRALDDYTDEQIWREAHPNEETFFDIPVK